MKRRVADSPRTGMIMTSPAFPSWLNSDSWLNDNCVDNYDNYR